jgi:hypothetical protein
MLGSNVFLEGGRTLALGQETDGVTLLEVVSPWKIRVKHKGKEYDVDVGQMPSESVFRPLTPGSLPQGMSVSPTPTGSPAASTGAAAGTPTVDARPATAPVAASDAEAPPPIPLPLTRAAVSRMDMTAAREAMAKVVAARGRDNLDPALSQRLESEEQWLVERISDLSR